MRPGFIRLGADQSQSISAGPMVPARPEISTYMPPVPHETASPAHSGGPAAAHPSLEELLDIEAVAADPRAAAVVRAKVDEFFAAAPRGSLLSLEARAAAAAAASTAAGNPATETDASASPRSLARSHPPSSSSSPHHHHAGHGGHSEFTSAHAASGASGAFSAADFGAGAGSSHELPLSPGRFAKRLESVTFDAYKPSRPETVTGSGGGKGGSGKGGGGKGGGGKGGGGKGSGGGKGGGKGGSAY